MKILVSDFDKTIYPDNFNTNVSLINKFVSDGNIFVIATGRNAKSMKKILKEKNINYSYLICNDGSVIYDKNFNIIRKIDIDSKTALEIHAYLTKNLTFVFFDNGYELTTNFSDKVDGIFGLLNDRNIGIKVLDYILNNYLNVSAYLSNNYINIVDKSVSKANAINYLEKLNDYKNIFVVGDGINDLSMYEKYDGFAISNSIVELKNLAKYEVDKFSDVINYLNKQ